MLSNKVSSLVSESSGVGHSDVGIRRMRATLRAAARRLATYLLARIAGGGPQRGERQAPRCACVG